MEPAKDSAHDGAVFDLVSAADSGKFDRRLETLLSQVEVVVDNMGQAHLLQSRFERSHHLDASESQDRAVADFERGLLVDPSLALAFRNLASAGLGRADEQARRGLDPNPGLNQIVQFVDRLNGDRTQPDRIAALTRVRARLGAAP